MSVTVLPYIDDKKANAVLEARVSSVSQEQSTDSARFQEVLNTALRTEQALAVDALIAAKDMGQVSVSLVQKLLGFDPKTGREVTETKSDKTDTSGNTTGAAQASSVESPEDLEPYFEEAARTYHVDINLLKAIAKTESGFNPSAKSSAGAMGVMQLMPSTAKSLGVSNPYNAHDNIMGGAKLIAQNIRRYNGNLSLALAGYNAGCGNVDKYGGIPPFKETQNYVKKVLSYYKG